MSFTRYVFSREGGRQVLRVILVYALIAGAVWLYLRWYTDHGEFVSVPDLRGLSSEEAIRSLEERDLTWMVVDSIYSEDADGGTIWEQSPSPESQVKEGRQIFLSVYCLLPPTEKITIEQGEYAPVALIKLKNKGMKPEVRYEPNNNLVGSVIKVSWKGKTLHPGDLVPRGEKIVMYVGESMSEKVMVPSLEGLSLDSALARLERSNLMLGNVITDNDLLTAEDSARARVCRQDPPHDPDSRVAPGRLVDIYVSTVPCSGDTLPGDSADPNPDQEPR